MKRPDVPESPVTPRVASTRSVTRGTPATPGKPAKVAKPAKPAKRAKVAKPAKPASATRAARKHIQLARKQRRAQIRADQRRFTAARRRRRLLVGSVLAAVGALFLGVFTVAYSPLMAVKTITVTGTSFVDAAAVTTALQGEIGTPLPLVNPDDIERVLSAFPAVQSFSTESIPPSTLVVRIVERTPVGVMQHDGVFDLVDSAGVVMQQSDTLPDLAPLLDVESTNSEAFRTVSSMMLALPADLRAQIRSAGATGGVDAWFQFANGPRVVWGAPTDPTLKLRVLQALLVTSSGSSELNVSAPNSPFVR